MRYFSDIETPNILTIIAESYKHFDGLLFPELEERVFNNEKYIKLLKSSKDEKEFNLNLSLILNLEIQYYNFKNNKKIFVNILDGSQCADSEIWVYPNCIKCADTINNDIIFYIDSDKIMTAFINDNKEQLDYFFKALEIISAHEVTHSHQHSRILEQNKKIIQKNKDTYKDYILDKREIAARVIGALYELRIAYKDKYTKEKILKTLKSPEMLDGLFPNTHNLAPYYELGIMEDPETRKYMFTLMMQYINDNF